MAAKADDDPPAYHTVYPGRSLTTKSTTPPRTEEEEGEEKVEKRLKEVKQESKTPKDIDVKKEDEESRLHRGCSRDDLTKTTRGIIKQASDMTQGAQDALVEFCNKTTAHGFNHIVKEEQHLLLRLFWLFVTMTGLVLLLSACYDVTYSALVTRRPSTQVIYHDLHSSGMRVPFMTICSLSGFWKSKMKKYNVSKTLASYLQLAIRGPDVANPWFDSRRREVLNDELDDYLKVNNLTLSEMVTLLSPSCEEVIVGCFSPRKDRYSNECCRDLFSPTITTLGLCYTTLTQGATLHLNQSITGLIGGHRILFAVNSQEYMEYDTNVVSTITLAEEGIHVSLSNFDLTPTVATNMQALRISPNTAVSVALSVTTLDRSERYLGVWPWSRSTCVTEQQFWEMKEEEKALTGSNLYYHIRYRTCPLALTNCSTLPYRFPNDTTDECGPKDVLNHRNKEDRMETCLLEHLKLNTSWNKLCQTTSITQQQSFTTLLKETLQAQEGVSIPPNETVSMLNVYYAQLGYTEYHERVSTIFTWFSDLGGQMGLFLGASFITLVELFFTACHVLRSILAKARKSVHHKTTTTTTTMQDQPPA